MIRRLWKPNPNSTRLFSTQPLIRIKNNHKKYLTPIVNISIAGLPRINPIEKIRPMTRKK